MGCCGCTLQTSAIVAAIFGIIQSVVGFITGIAVLTNYYRYHIDNDVVAKVLISATAFNGFWLLATIVLIIGIIKSNALMHRVWVGATSAIMIVDLVHTIIFIIRIVHDISYTSQQQYYYFNNNTLLILALVITAVSRGSIWLWIVNICLTIYTAHRAVEIERGPNIYPPGQTIIVYGDQPVHPYAFPGQTVVVHHGGTTIGMPPAYQQAQYGQTTADPNVTGTEKGLPAKY